MTRSPSRSGTVAIGATLPYPLWQLRHGLRTFPGDLVDPDFFQLRRATVASRQSRTKAGIGTRLNGEGLGLLENWLGCTLPKSQPEGGLSVGAVGPQGASRWRDYPPRSVRARSFAP